MYYQQYQVYSQIHFVEIGCIRNSNNSMNQSAALNVKTKHVLQALESITTVISYVIQRAKHIPYRNTKLTHLLQDCLTRKSNILFMLNVIPNVTNISQTLKTLRFGEQIFIQMYNLRTAQTQKVTKKISNIAKKSTLNNTNYNTSTEKNTNNTQYDTFISPTKRIDNFEIPTTQRSPIHVSTTNHDDRPCEQLEALDLDSIIQKISTKNSQRTNRSRTRSRSNLNSNGSTNSSNKSPRQSKYFSFGPGSGKTTQSFSSKSRSTKSLFSNTINNTSLSNARSNNITTNDENISILKQMRWFILNPDNIKMTDKRQLIKHIDNVIDNISKKQSELKQINSENDQLRDSNAKQIATIQQLTKVIASMNNVNTNSNSKSNVSNFTSHQNMRDINAKSDISSLSTSMTVSSEPSGASSASSIKPDQQKLARANYLRSNLYGMHNHSPINFNQNTQLNSKQTGSLQFQASRKIEAIESRLKKHCAEISHLKQNILNSTAKNLRSSDMSYIDEMSIPAGDINVHQIVDKNVAGVSDVYECESFALESIDNKRFL